MKYSDMHSRLGFDALRGRLLEQIRRRIRNGEITERALARKAGMSQPHLHNLLKGIRGLNAPAADQLLGRLGLSALDLLDASELRGELSMRARECETWLEVPVRKGCLGPDLPWPGDAHPNERVKVPLRYACGAQESYAVRLGTDRAMEPVLNAGDIVLLGHTNGADREDPDALFAVVSNGAAAIRWVRTGRRGLYLLSVANRDQPCRWELIAAADGVIRARAIPLRWMHPHEPGDDAPPPPRDRPREPVRPSFAS